MDAYSSHRGAHCSGSCVLLSVPAQVLLDRLPVSQSPVTTHELTRYRYRYISSRSTSEDSCQLDRWHKAAKEKQESAIAVRPAQPWSSLIASGDILEDCGDIVGVRSTQLLLLDLSAYKTVFIHQGTDPTPLSTLPVRDMQEGGGVDAVHSPACQ